MRSKSPQQLCGVKCKIITQFENFKYGECENKSIIH